MKREPIIQHIRRKLPRNRGNQWYRDTNRSSNGNLCGAAETEYDLGFKGRAVAWTRASDGQAFEPCPDCVETRQNG